MTDLEIQKLQQENKLLKRKLVLLKKKCNKLVVSAYNTSESDINKLSLLKKEIKELKQENKRLYDALHDSNIIANALYSMPDPEEVEKVYKENQILSNTKKALKLLINRLNLKLYHTVLVGSCVIKVETEDYLNDNKDGNRRYYITEEEAKFLNVVFKEAQNE